VHFTPTSASWLNQVERWFAMLTERQIRRGMVKTLYPRVNWVRCRAVIDRTATASRGAIDSLARTVSTLLRPSGAQIDAPLGRTHEKPNSSAALEYLFPAIAGSSGATRICASNSDPSCGSRRVDAPAPPGEPPAADDDEHSGGSSQV
jgi:hypothetical protein